MFILALILSLNLFQLFLFTFFLDYFLFILYFQRLELFGKKPS